MRQANAKLAPMAVPDAHGALITDAASLTIAGACQSRHSRAAMRNLLEDKKLPL